MKKDIMFVGVSICLLILLGIGLSYSMWNMRVSQDTNNVISTTDCFDITLANQSNAIKLDNAYPITDTKGKTLTPFTFSIKNVCDTAVAYTVSLESLEGTTLASDHLKVMVNNNEPLLLNGLSTTDVVNTTSIESRILDTGTLFKNNTKEYSIRLWIDYNTTLDDLNNETKVLKSKVIIKGVPSNEKESIPDLLTERIAYLADRDTTNFASDDPDSNVRYIGKDPSNYVYFNCSDYNNQTADTCELWRIIGVFNNVTKGDGTKENLVKIIRNETLGNFNWDTSNVNDWTTSSLQDNLNGGGYYYAENHYTTNAIEEVEWDLGGSSTYNDVTASMFYERERGTAVYGNHATTWIGKTGLMYPSDYGYATSGGTTKDRGACLAEKLHNWSTSDFSDCKGNDYLFDANLTQWTLTPDSTDTAYVFAVSKGGFVSTRGDISYYSHAVRPTFYLKSNIQVDKGTGESSNPYTLKMQ